LTYDEDDNDDDNRWILRGIRHDDDDRWLRGIRYDDDDDDDRLGRRKSVRERERERMRTTIQHQTSTTVSSVVITFAATLVGVICFHVSTSLRNILTGPQRQTLRR